uniref:TNFR-Cys domain-containing protein n=1 Tax=Branchiostoma floridae TaxID=7739 RepID=C3Y0R1_BRAFL|eukprot:XP_002610034.1 hypothetical protein BRAFLDRAFT_129216 [Branchiostoma floridae]
MAFRLLKEVLMVVLTLHPVTVWSDTCPVGQVPDGIGGNCVACSTCEKYPTSPYCELCPASADRSAGTDGLTIGLSVTGALIVLAAAAGALWYWKPWRLQQGQQPEQQPPQVVVCPPRDERQCAQLGLPEYHQPMRGESPGHVKQEQGARNDRNPNHVAVGSYRQLAGHVQQQQDDARPLLHPPDHNRNTVPKGARDEVRL